MDWFEKLTGFSEISYADTLAKLKVDGDRLRSLVTGETYGIGELELVSLSELRKRVKSASGPIGRLEINVAAVERYLLFREINYDPITKKDSSAGKGSRPYSQTDIKLFFAKSTKGRYGLRMAYTRGSLPPVFADLKSVQFGFVFETADDKAR